MTARPQDAALRRGRRAARLRRAVTGWGFVSPFTILFAVFMAGPVLISLAMSFTDMRSADVRDPLGVNFVGLDQYAKVFGDPLFLKASGNTAFFVLVGVPLTMAAGLAVALGLNSGLTRFKTVFRVGYYLPVVTSIVAVSVVWRFLLQPDTGLVNGLLGLVGVDGPNWLDDENLSLPSLVVMAAWRNLGFQMVIFLAGLQAIPANLYEAARLDGASRRQQFRHVTLPMLRPTMLFVAVITTISYLQFFEESYVMTQGGPLNSTLSVSFHVFKQFGFGNYGYASAMSYVLFVAIVALSLLWFRLLKRKDQ
ncbi:carbohydrate ABC transporter permease [Phytomonospora endophytica]|uniref:Multiple sugar transport system permease protein n=1 Tax=Phytomonospora endophytica TaxID=714109 RepID=A0A841FCR4_9ACTN|nr:sugar ABC transporter permease [Phytomonospora endophytica]MBB6035081.1 multiple sugar transport system permease protein [Phytomonospora endophytica]GIG64170.1 sugar ABC transporter permease [Phytomonospora endophytica]